MPRLRSVTSLALFFLLVCGVDLHAGIAVVRHAPTINGTVQGSIQQLSAESVVLNSSAVITEDLLVPGVPRLVKNGNPSYSGTQPGSGASTPTNHTVTLNSGSSLRHLVTRTDSIALPVVIAPRPPVGTRSVSLNSASGIIGSFETLKNLTINSNVGQISVPPGRYGKFTANSGSGFTLGVNGASEPSLYELETVILNSGSKLQIVGPVIVRLANTLSASAIIGASAHPEWLRIEVSRGGLTLNSGARLYGFVSATSSSGRIILNGNAHLIGGALCDRLTINSGGLLRLDVVPANVPPSITIIAPATGATYSSPATFAIQAVATDPDGTVAKVEYYDGETKLGATTGILIAPATFEYTVELTGVGSHRITAVATDNTGATTTSAAVDVTVISAPPTIAFDIPDGGTVLASPAAIDLSVTVAGQSGHTIAKVEFFDGPAKIGESTTHGATPFSFTLPYTFSGPGVYVFTARVTDSAGLSSVTVVPLLITVLASLPYTADFELSEGYLAASLAGQLGWTVEHGSASVTGNEASNGEQSVVLEAGSPAAHVEQVFSSSSEKIVFVDFFAKPIAAATIASLGSFNIEGAQFGFIRSGGQARLNVFAGNGVGDGEWTATGFLTQITATHQTRNWVRLTSRIDFNQGKWDLYADGRMVAADLGLLDGGSTHLASIIVEGDSAGSVLIDDLFAGWPHPLFADSNENGLDDAWEIAHGLSLATDNRNSSPSDNGITVVQAYIAGTDPNDFYNGAIPNLTIVEGDNQAAPAGQFNALAFTVEVRGGTDATLLIRAPVTFTVEDGGGTLASTKADDAERSNTIQRVTDSDGRVSVYYRHASFALRESKISVAAGLNEKTFTTTSTAIEVLSGGGDTVLWQDGTGITRLWGSNTLGQLGDGATISRSQMRKIAGINEPITAAALGAGHGLAVTESGLVYAWGDNQFRQAGDLNLSVLTEATVIAGLTTVVGVAAGDAHSLALDRDGLVWSWGANQSGQLGDGTDIGRATPVLIAGLSNIVMVAAGSNHSAALSKHGTVWVWGSNDFGQLASAQLENRSSPVPVVGLPPALLIVSGRKHFLALCRDGTVWGWGDNHAGQLGIGDFAGRVFPERIGTSLPVVGLAAGSNHSVARCADGTVLVWGGNNVGQLGNGTTLPSAAPLPLSLTDVKIISAGWDHVVVVRSDGSLQAWGVNELGQLGTQTVGAYSDVPINVTSPEAEL